MLSTTKIRTTVVAALPILLPTSAAEPKRDANIWLCNGLNGNGPVWLHRPRLRTQRCLLLTPC
jgi:hypothetical protein